MYKFESIREELESKGFPDGRTVKHDKILLEKIYKATSFLPKDVKLVQRLLCIDMRWTELPKCQHCGGDNVYSRKKKYSKNYAGFTKYCSSECSAKSEVRMKNTRKTMLKRYGVEYSGQNPELLAKMRKTTKERYGDEIALRNQSIMNAFKSTMMERHGVSYSLQSPELYQKAVDTWIKNLGTTTPLQNKEVATKRDETWERKYNGHPNKKHYTEKANSILNDKNKLEEHYHHYKSADIASMDLDVSKTTYREYMKAHGIEVIRGSHSSSYEFEICRFLEEHGLSFEMSNRTILDGLESDIVVENNLIIEFNGLYWHSDIHKPRKYHQDKSLTAHKKGFDIIHIWEDDWLNKKEIVKKKILTKCGVISDKVYARKCSIRQITNNDVIDFYNNNHIQGHINASFIYGLFENDSLVAAISFKRTKDGVFDLSRYATSKNVVGGFSKLLKHFNKNHDFKMIQTFASLDYSKGDVYLKNGFVLDSITKPNYTYAKGGVRYSRQRFMKSKLERRLESFDESLSEDENMKMNGYLKIYDSGSMKFLMYK